MSKDVNLYLWHEHQKGKESSDVLEWDNKQEKKAHQGSSGNVYGVREQKKTTWGGCTRMHVKHVPITVYVRSTDTSVKCPTTSP